MQEILVVLENQMHSFRYRGVHQIHENTFSHDATRGECQAEARMMSQGRVARTRAPSSVSWSVSSRVRLRDVDM